MQLRDIVKYRGYMPVRMEREDTLEWIGGLVGGSWIKRMWLSKYSGYHQVRYRFGDVQEAQLYMKDKSWKPMPIGMWLKFSEMDRNALDDDCWKWIQSERQWNGMGEKKAKATLPPPTRRSNGGGGVNGLLGL